MPEHDLQTLRLFCAVIEEGSIASAARRCSIAPSAVSKRIADLEHHAKVALLYRLRDGVEATSAGLALYGHAKSVLEAVGRLDSELSEFALGLSGRIRIFANTSAITQFLPEDLKHFGDLYPDVRFDLLENTSARNIDAAVNGDCDLAIFNGHVPHQALETRLYRRDTLQVVAPKGHAIAQRRSVSLVETLQYDHVGLQEGSSLQDRIQTEARRHDGHVRFRVQVYSFDGIRRMVEAGLGIAILPEGAVTPYLASLALDVVALDEPWAVRDLLVGYRAYRSLPLPCRRLVDHVAPVEPQRGD